MSLRVPGVRGRTSPRARGAPRVETARLEPCGVAAVEEADLVGGEDRRVRRVVETLDLSSRHRESLDHGTQDAKFLAISSPGVMTPAHDLRDLRHVRRAPGSRRQHLVDLTEVIRGNRGRARGPGGDAGRDHAAPGAARLPRTAGRSLAHPAARPHPPRRGRRRVARSALEPHRPAPSVAVCDRRCRGVARPRRPGARHAPWLPRRRKRPVGHDDPPGVRPQHRKGSGRG